MSDFGFSKGKVIETDGGGAIRAVGIASAFIMILVLSWASLAYVPAGHVGVLTVFGHVTGQVLSEGTHFANPFAVNNTASIRTQTIKETASVPSNEGLLITLDTSLLYRLDATKAAQVFQTIGPNYEEVIIEPTLRSAIRETTASHEANALYSGEREKVASEIFAQLNRELAPRGIVVENVLLRDIQLPATLKASIEAKQQAEQESLAMSFRLQKEKQEADRKRIEAAGIRDFQQIVAQGISPQLLEWKGIEATETLGKSPNTKIVVIGNSKNGLPLIMGGQ
ncbi:MAG: prohibitin family protein [Terriglobales bacterium]|jgi:regulator of protease activity HflC (stomatin/prohibitin superfamily)